MAPLTPWRPEQWRRSYRGAVAVLVFVILPSIAHAAQSSAAPNFGWQLQLPAPNAGGRGEYSFSGVSQQQMVTDTRGNSYLAAYVGGSVTIGGIAVKPQSSASCYQGTTRMVNGFGIVVKTNATGQVQWISQVSVPCGNALALGISVDSLQGVGFLHVMYQVPQVCDCDRTPQATDANAAWHGRR